MIIYKNMIAFGITLFSFAFSFAQKNPLIVIHTDKVALVFKVANQHLCQAYLGTPLSAADYQLLKVNSVNQAYSAAGMSDHYNTAIRVKHVDGNPSLNLEYVSHQAQTLSDNVRLTTIQLKDPEYPFKVTLYYKAFKKENVIKTWSVIRHQERGDVLLQHYASADLYLNASHYWLLQFHSDWAKEMQMQESELTSGIKVIDSKLGVRATMHQNPGFMLSLNKPAGESYGEVLAGTLAWSGNFKLSFQVDNENTLHIISGINPAEAVYPLAPNTDFKTPAFIFTYSNQGKGLATRNIDRWARRYGILDGNHPKMILFNNWKATYFNFDEKKLTHLFDQAKEIGVDIFLLDDGWFGNKYPRNGSNAGLGDWQFNKKKLPHGLGYLVKQARERELKFGLWIEPEMVNPRSELYHKHPDWVLKLPNRPENYQRNQLVLDLSSPQVQDFVYDVVDGLMTNYPNIAYFKWDCNRTFSNEYSLYEEKQQSKLYVDYVRGLYKVLQRLRKKYPHLPMMLCSGGGGRVDYGALQYFTEFWPSDNTNPMDRIMIQWGYSYLYPAIATAAHVTESENYSLKFNIDVAMMGRLGFSILFDALSDKEMAFIQNAVKTYHSIKSLVWFGDVYRLVSPYKGNRAALMYIAENKDSAVVFTFSMHDNLNPINPPIHLNGLDPNKQYFVKEINLPKGAKSHCRESGHVYSGKYLINVGIHSPIGRSAQSAVFEVVAQ